MKEGERNSVFAHNDSHQAQDYEEKSEYFNSSQISSEIENRNLVKFNLSNELDAEMCQMKKTEEQRE